MFYFCESIIEESLLRHTLSIRYRNKAPLPVEAMVKSVKRYAVDIRIRQGQVPPFNSGQGNHNPICKTR